jgi:hypothetical protein
MDSVINKVEEIIRKIGSEMLYVMNPLTVCSYLQRMHLLKLMTHLNRQISVLYK